MRIILALALHAVVLAVGIWDVVAIARRRPADTVSATLYDWSVALPILPYILGIITGHLFWPLTIQRPPPQTPAVETPLHKTTN